MNNIQQRLLTEDLEYILEHTHDIWSEFKDTRIFITGGTGFFGKWIIKSFLHANDRLNLNSSMVVLSRNPQRFLQQHPYFINKKEITFEVGDVNSVNQIPLNNFSHVIHAATDASDQLNRENPLLMINTIAQGTQNTLEFAINSKVQKFLFISSGAIYGKQPATIEQIPETYEGAPSLNDLTSAYGQGKRLAEHFCIQYANKYPSMKIKIARCFAFVGPYLPLDRHFAIGNFINDGLQDRDILVNGDGTSYRSYLYTTDLTIWLWNILSKGKNAQAYNVGSDQAYSIKEIAEIISDSFAHKPKVIIKKPQMVSSVINKYIPDTQRTILDHKLPTPLSLREAVARTIQWHREA